MQNEVTLRQRASEMDKSNVVCTQLRLSVFVDIAHQEVKH